MELPAESKAPDGGAGSQRDREDEGVGSDEKTEHAEEQLERLGGWTVGGVPGHERGPCDEGPPSIRHCVEHLPRGPHPAGADVGAEQRELRRGGGSGGGVWDGRIGSVAAPVWGRGGDDAAREAGRARQQVRRRRRRRRHWRLR